MSKPMTKTKNPRWVNQVRAACPAGWSVRDMRGKVYLRVRSNGADANATLPLAWAADKKSEIIGFVSDLQELVEGGLDLRDAIARLKSSSAATKPSSTSQWPVLLEKFHDDLKLTCTLGLNPVTWEANYRPFLEYGVELMGRPGAPVNARELVSEVVKRWADKPRSRQKAVAAWKAFLEVAVEDFNLPGASWTLTDRAAKKLRGDGPGRREVACLTDVEILDLLDSFSKTEAGDRWRNAIKLLALYGLRPEELHHLVVQEHPKTGKPALKCTYLKAAQRKNGRPRWLMPLPLTNSSGELEVWNLAGAMSIGQLPLPPLGDKYAVRTFLRRQPKWRELIAKYKELGLWIRPYSFRNSYSIRAHNAGRQNDVICRAMGHTLDVHSTSYEWGSADAVLEYC